MQDDAGPSPQQHGQQGQHQTREQEVEAYIKELSAFHNTLAAEKRPAKWARKFEKGTMTLREQLTQFQELLSENGDLHARLASRQRMLELASAEELWHRHTMPLQTPPPLPGAAAAAGPITLVNLPHPDVWDRSWEQRVMQLGTRDLLLIHKEWLHKSALILYKAEHLGPASREHQQLSAMSDRYGLFTQHAMRLIPRVWRERSFYDLETMKQVEAPSRAWFRDFMSQMPNKKAALQIFEHYHALSAQLRLQQVDLMQGYVQLAAGLFTHADPTAAAAAPSANAQQAGSEGRGAEGAEAGRRQSSSSGGGRRALLRALGPGDEPGPSQPQATARRPSVTAAQAYKGDAVGEVDQVLARLQANLGRQQLALRQCVHAVREASKAGGCVGMVKSHLLMYPLALDTIDFVEALGPGGDAEAGGPLGAGTRGGGGEWDGAGAGVPWTMGADSGHKRRRPDHMS